MRKGKIFFNSFTLYGRIKSLKLKDGKYTIVRGVIVTTTKNDALHELPFMSIGNPADEFRDVEIGDMIFVTGQLASNNERNVELWINNVYYVYSDNDYETLKRDEKQQSEIFDDYQGKLPEELPHLEV